MSIEHPDVHQSVLDPDTLCQLFDDLDAHAEVLDVLAKGAPERRADEAPITLRDAQRMLADHQVFAVQIRYRWSDSEWRDTLMRTPEGVKVVRIDMGFLSH